MKNLKWEQILLFEQKSIIVLLNFMGFDELDLPL